MRRLAATVTLACSAATSCLATSGALGAPGRSPAGRILVVTQNLHADSRSEMRGLHAATHVFARRLLNQVPHRPDVILLQEVARRSARKVASVMTKKTPDRYAVVKSVRPSARWVRMSNGRVRATDTAVVINAGTMRRTGRGGWIRTAYARRHARGDVTVRRHAHVPVAERATGMRAALVSLHWVRRSDLRNDRIARAYQERWAARAAERLRRRYGAGTVRVVGGDFNQHRCAFRATRNCVLAPFYRRLTRRLGYRDPIFAATGTAGVDHIFTTGGFTRAGADFSYDKERAEGHPNRWYSDHRFRWAVLDR